MKTTLKCFIASIMLAVLTAAPIYASCGQDLCLGPCIDEELLYDTTFSGNCDKWVWAGSAQRVPIGTNWLAQFAAPGTLSQVVSTGSYKSMTVAFTVSITATKPGTERLYVEILRGYSVLETVEVLYGGSGGGVYRTSIENYSNDIIKIRFRRVNGTAPGDTVFLIDTACMWGNYYS